MPNDTKNLIVTITAQEMNALLQGKALSVIPAPGPGKRIVVEYQGIPRFRSVQSSVSCEIDFKYHVEDVQEDVADPQPTGGKKR
jgi:hypothetical protein